MASLRPSTASAAARLLRTATFSPRSSILPASRRFESSTPSSSSTAVSPKQAKAEDLAPTQRNAPDYDVPVDQATSMFTPVPKTIQDGSEENLPLPAGLISGAPLELQARTVRIYQPSKPATQSGTAKGSRWRMDWDVLGKGHRWENPLMGWQSTADSMQGTHLSFQSKEDAIHFAEKQGYEYFVQEPNTRAFTPKAYANNFTYSPGKLKIIRTK